jgi:hypothetical protein
MDRYLSGTPIQSMLFRYILFLQVFSYCFLPCYSWSTPFLCFRDDLKYHYVLVFQEFFIGYDQTITNGVESGSLELILPQICLVDHHFLFDLSLYDHIPNTTSIFRLHSSFKCGLLKSQYPYIII